MALAVTGSPSARAIGMSVKFSPNWDKVVNRYRRVNGAEELKRTGLIKWAMREGVKVAVSELDKAVYSQPSTGYVRTGRLRNAVMERPDVISGVKGDSGAIVVNKSRFNEYYPLFVEGGTSQMAARHYWRNTKVRMRAEFGNHGSQALKQLKVQLTVR